MQPMRVANIMSAVGIDMKKITATKGFSLIEMLLVLAVISAILMAVMGYTVQKSDEMRRDRAVTQIQQIQNAALAYYISTSAWPPTIQMLTGNGYLPNITIKSPWATDYAVKSNVTMGTFSVCTTVNGSVTTAPATAQVIAGRVPMGYVANGATAASSPCPTAPTTCNSASCTVISQVSVPGQNLNNARSVNFAGVYRNGGCVPAPYCPQNMTPTIYAIPVNVQGVYDANYPNKLYPLTGFTAYATGQLSSGSSPKVCNSSTTLTCGSGLPAAPFFWRVCMKIVTDKGPLSDAGVNTVQQDAAYILAITRCKPSTESQGSGFDVFISFHDNKDY